MQLPHRCLCGALLVTVIVALVDVVDVAVSELDSDALNECNELNQHDEICDAVALPCLFDSVQHHCQCVRLRHHAGRADGL